MKLINLIFIFILVTACAAQNNQPKDLMLNLLDITSKKRQMIEMPYMEKFSLQFDTLTGDSIYNNGYFIGETTPRDTSKKKSKFILGSAYFNDS